MMATSVSKEHWTNTNKMNWYKGVEVMDITDEAIRPFVEKEITNFLSDIISEFRSICGKCKSTNASNCYLSMCSKIALDINSVHRYWKPCYKNSDITKWLSDPWEIAKCYMSPSKDLKGKPGSEIDFSNVLNLVINNKRFQRLITDVDMNYKNNMFCKGRNARNEAMHLRRHQMTAHDLDHHCKIFIDIVNKIGTDKAECVQKIKQVRDSSLYFTTEEENVKLKEHEARYQRRKGELKKIWREEIKKGKMKSPDTTEDRLLKPIYKIFSRIAKNLEEDEKLSFINIIRTAAETKTDEDNTKVEEFIDEFTELTMFRRGISVNLIKQGVRSLIELKLDSNHATDIYNGVRTVKRRFLGGLIFSIFGKLDEAALNKYLEMLKERYECVRHIRLMVVGMSGNGKTTTIRRLCNEGVSNVKSTVGIDVSVNACEIDDNNEWKVTEEAKKKKYYESRFAHANIPEEVTYMPIEQMKPKVEVPNPVKEIKTQAIKKSSRQNLAVDENEKFVKPEKRITTVSIWDFAGRSIYFSTHHFFLSARAIYLLVLNISQRLDAPVLGELDNDGLDRASSMPKGFTCRDAFKFWMNSIYTYTASRNDTSKLYCPTIVLVGTFKDVVKEKYKEKCLKDNNFLEEYKENYFKDALESFANSEVIKLVHPKKFFISRDDPAEVFSALKNRLTSIAEKQSFWNELAPMDWISLEMFIEIRKPVRKQTADACLNNTGTNESNVKGADAKHSKTELKDEAGIKAYDTDNTNLNIALMELEELKSVYRAPGSYLADRKQIQDFLKFQHALGNVLYFDAEQLEDTIILDPQWILNVFKLFVAHAREKLPTQLKEWDNYEKNAILSSTLIDELIAQAEDTTFTRNKGNIIQYMEYLDVIAKPVFYPEAEVEGDSSSDEEGENVTGVKGKKPLDKNTKDFYIVPCLLSQKPPEKELQCKTPKNAKSTPILCMVFKNDFLPAFVCHRLMATCITKWEVPLYNRIQLMVFNGMGRFLLNPGKTMWLSLWWKDNIIYMQIFLCTEKKKPIDGQKCKKVLQHVQKMIRGIFSIHRNFTGDVEDNQQIQYDEYIKCPKCVEDEAKVHVGSETTELAPEEIITEKSKMLLVRTFATKEDVDCKNCHTIGREAALSKWFSERNEKYRIAKLCHLREEVFNWLKKNPESDEITVLHLAELLKHIGKEYTVLEIELGLNLKIIEQIDMGEKDIKTGIEKILSEWKKTCQEIPTVRHIKPAILKVLGICLEKGKYREEEISKQKIVKWFETKLGTGMPTERELLEVAYFVNGNYKKLRKPLSLSYSYIEQIEEMYCLDINRTLAVLVKWKKSNTNVSYNTLKDILVKLRKIDWEDAKAKIEKDKEDPPQQEDDDDYDIDKMINPEERNEIEKKRSIRMQGYKREKGPCFDGRDQDIGEEDRSDMDVVESGDNVNDDVDDNVDNSVDYVMMMCVIIMMTAVIITWMMKMLIML